MSTRDSIGSSESSDSDVLGTGNRFLEDQVNAVNQNVAAADSHVRSIADVENMDFIDDGRNSGRTGMETDSNADRDRFGLSLSGPLTVDVRSSAADSMLVPGPPPGLPDRSLEIVATLDSVGRSGGLGYAGIADTSGTQGRDAGEELRELLAVPSIADRGDAVMQLSMLASSPVVFDPVMGATDLSEYRAGRGGIEAGNARTPTLAIEDLAGLGERMEEGPFANPSETVLHGTDQETTGDTKGTTGSRIEIAIEDRVDSLAVSSSSDHDRTIRRNDDGIDAMMNSGELGAEGDRMRSADSGHWMGRKNGDDIVPGVYSNSAAMIGNVGIDPTDLELIAKGSSAVAQNMISESDDRALSVFSSTGLSEASPGGNVEALKDVGMGQTSTIGIEWGSHGIRSALEETGVITDADFVKFFTDQAPGNPGSTPMTMHSESQERWNVDEGLRKQRAEQAVKEMNQIAESVPAAKKSKSTEIGGPIHQAGMITPDQGSEGWGNRSPAPRSPGIGGQYEHFGINTPPEGRGRNDEMRATSSPPRRAKVRTPADPDKSSLGEIDGRIDDSQTVVVDTQTDVAKLKVASECASAIANSSAEKADVVSKRLVECEEEVKHWKGWIESQQIDTKTTLSQELKEMSRIMDGSVSEDRMDDAMAPQLTEGAIQLARRMRRQVENVKVLKTSVTTRLKGVEERLSTAEHSADIAKQSAGTKIATLETGLNEVKRGIGVVFSSMQMRHENGTWKNERLDKVETVLNRQWDQIKLAGEELRKLKSKGSQKGHGLCIDGAVRVETKKLSEVVLAQKEHIMTVAREVIKNRKSVAEIVAGMTKVHKTCENVVARTERVDEKRNGEQAWVKDTVRKMEKTMESMSSRMIDEQKRVTGEFILVNARIDESTRNEGIGKTRGNSAEIGKPPTMSRGRDGPGGSRGADGRARSDNARGMEASRPEMTGPVVDRRIENRCIVLEQQVAKITGQLQGLTTVNERIVKENASLISEIESMKGENKGVTESVARMVRDSRDEISKMRADLDLRGREMLELKEKNEQLEATVREYERRLEQVRRNDSLKAELDSMWHRIGEIGKQSSEYAMPAPGVGGASNAGSARPSVGATPAPRYAGTGLPRPQSGRDHEGDDARFRNPVGGGYNKFKDTRGMEKCNEISIAKEPSSGEVGLWLGDVAHTAKAAYLYDGDYAYTQVLRVRERSEAMIDMELKYPALENQLFSGLKRAIKSESLSAKVKMEMYKTQQVGDGKPMTAMRLLTLIVKHVEIPIAKESQVLYDGLSSTKVMNFPGKPEEEALEEFMTRWDLAHTNLIGLKGNTWSEQQLGWMLHSKVQRVQVLNHDIEAWRLLPDESKTHTWLRKRIKDRLEMWRADKNIDEASMRVSRQAFTTGYAAMPAQQGSYRAEEVLKKASEDSQVYAAMPVVRQRDDGHTADKMVRKCKNVHKKGYVHDVKRYPVIEEAKARLRGISLAEEVVLDILAGEQGEEGKDASRLADRIVEECRRIGIVDERFRVDSREDSQPAASAQHCLPSVMRRWMIDSGCAMDLIAEADLTQDEKDMAIEAKKVRFNTANGNTTSKQEICMDIQGMPETMRIRMLESTPAVLSMGRRCMKMGYSFHWLAGANPVFVKPDSSLIVLKVIGDIPYMVDRMSTVVSESERSDYHIYPAMPAPLAIELPVRGNSSPRRIGEKQDECSPKSVDSDTDRDIEEEPIGKAANDDGRLLDKWMLTGNKAVCFHNKPRTKACDPWFETLRFPEIHALVPRFAERCRSKRVYKDGQTVAEWIDWVDKYSEGENREAEEELWTGKTMFKIEGLTYEGADAGEAAQSDSVKVRKHILDRIATDETTGLNDLLMMLDKTIGTSGEAETLVRIAKSRNGPERWGYSFISWAQKQECRDDDIIILRVCMLVVIGKDPETYWDETPDGGYASLWATEEWDRTRPGTGATNDGDDRSKGEMNESQNWSEWAPGLVRAIKETMRKHHRISSVVEKGIDERNRETTAEQDDGDGRLRTTFYCAACKADSSGVCGFCERALSPEQIEAGQSARNMTDAEFQLIHGMKKSPDDDLRIAEQVVAVPGEEESAENGGELDDDIDLPGIADEEQARRGVGEPQKDDSAGDVGEVEQAKAEDGPADQVRVADRIGEGIGSSKTVSIRRARYSPEYAKSTEHLLTHLPKNMHCVACRQGKAINVPFNRGEGITDKGAEKFGERVTADTIVLRSNKDKGIRGENNAIVMFDFKTQWIHCTPVKSRGTDEFVRAINEFRGPDMVVHLYADGAGEFSKACDVIGTCRATSTPGLPRTNSIAELKVKEVIYGGRVLLRQAGLEPKWWPYAVQTFCFHRNVQQVDGVSPYGKRHGNEQDKVKLIPFGALVNYLPIAEKPRKAGKEDAALLERGDPENDALEILGADEDVSSMALPSETKETKEQRSQREEELREIDRRALDMVMTQDFDVQHAKDIILKFTSIEKGIAKNSRSMATGRGFIVLGLYAYGGKIGVTNSAKEYPGIAMVCCELIAKCFPEATFTTVIVSVGTRMGPHKDKFNESQTYNFVVPVSERAGEAMIWTEEEQCASEGGKAAGIEKEVLPGKWIWGRTRKVDSGLKFNPRVWHATEDALAPEDRVIAVGYTLAAGKKASVDDKWKLMRLGFRLDEHFATLADGLCQAACADDGGDGEEYVDHDAEEEQAYAVASKAKFDTPTSPGLFLGYALQPGGVPSGDYIVVELAHLYHGWTVPSIHRVKRIVLDEEMPNYFPTQAVADRKSRIMTATRADALARLELEREGQQGEETEEIFAEERRVRADVMRQIKCDDQHLQNGDFWEHDEIDHSWTLHHILPRKELCTPGEEVKGTGGPGDRELGPRRRTWIVYADGTSEVLDEDRMKGKKKITKKWTGCTTFWEKGEPEGEIDDEAKERARGEKATGIRGVGLDYEQDMPRIERPYARSHKPNSISSAEWNRMSPGQRLRYIEGDKERIIRGERPPSAVRGQEEIGPRPAEIGVREWMEKITDHGQEFSPPEYRWDPPPGMPEGGRVWAVRNNRATSYRFYGGRDKRRLELWWRVTRSANTGEVLESIEYDSCIQAEMMRNRGRYRFVVPRDIITEFWYIPDGGEDRRIRDRGESAEPAAPASRMGDTEEVTKTINQLCSTAGIARTPSDNIVGEMMRELGEQPKVQIMGVGLEEIGGNGGENVSWISGEGCVIGEGVTDVVIAIDASSDGMRTEVDRKASGWRREEGLDSTREARERVFGNVEKVITDANSRGIVATIIWIGGKSRMADETIVRMALAWDMWIVRSDGCMLGMHDGVDASCYIGVVTPCMMNAIAADMLACDHMPRDHDLMSRIVRTSDAKIDVRREQEGKAIREMIKVLKDVIDICGEEEGDSVSMACEEHEGDYLGYSSGMVTLDVDSLAQLEKGTIRGDENYAAAAAEDGAPYISREEIRWKRCIVMNNPGREALREIFGPRAKHTQDLRVILVDGDDIGKVMMTKQNSRRIRHSTGGAAVAYPGEELEVGDLNGDGWMIVLTGERENHDADRRHDQDREENPGFDDQSDVFDSEGWTLSDLEEEREPVDEAFFRAGHAETINLETMEKGECNIVMWEAERNALVLELKDDIHVPLIGYTWVRTGIAYPEDPGTSVRVSALGQLVAETMCDVIGYEVSPEREILVAIQNRNSFPITFGGGGGPIMRMEFAKGVCLRPRMRGCMMPENVKEVRHRRAHRESKKAIWAREARARERDRDSVDHGLRARRSRDEDRRRIGIKHVSNRTYKCRECRRLLEGKAKVPSLILTSMTLCFACFMNKHTTPVDNLIRQGYQTEDEEYGDGIVAVPAIQVDADQEDSWEEVAENEVCDSIDETVGECEPLMATIIEDEEEDIEEVFGLVARPVTKAERAINPKARAALDKEWKKLMDQVVWIMEEVRSWKDVQREAMDRGEIAHVGRIFDICVEKNWELAEDDPLRKYKGRVVFEGCHVKDQEGKWAIFQEITSCPATLEAGKMADAYGMLPGHDIEMSDGESAYTQVGFEFLSDWPSVFFHKELKLMLVIYVDDFKLVGPKENLDGR
ncbi:RE2 [Symbiodinium natans]|uniref:RE2 protein n=1 Tax=Symbiodinium natans TaxID=878477 RepID=A0A812GH90_9DINO|nr:RE2 [Symbiodinium natans]